MSNKWHRIVDKTTGEVQHVASLGGIDLDQFQVTPIKGNREPGEFHVVHEDGSMSVDKEAQDRALTRQLTFEERVAKEVEKALNRLRIEKEKSNG